MGEVTRSKCRSKCGSSYCFVFFFSFFLYKVWDTDAMPNFSLQSNLLSTQFLGSVLYLFIFNFVLILKEMVCAA